MDDIKRMRERFDKLNRLGKSSNPHEAKLAREKAEQIKCKVFPISKDVIIEDYLPQEQRSPAGNFIIAFLLFFGIGFLLFLLAFLV